MNYQCSSHFGIKNDSKNGMVSHGAVVFGQPGGGVRLFEDKVIEMVRLDFSDLFDFLRKVDYLLMPLDYHTYEVMHYISVSTSGTKQISLGISIPVICNEIIGKQYGFHSNNAILYTENQLEDALRRVLQIKMKEMK